MNCRMRHDHMLDILLISTAVNVISSYTLPDFVLKTTMIESIVLTVKDYWQLILPVVLVAYLARNYLNKGLSKYPGPFLANFTDGWRFIDVYNRRPDITQLALHRKHGEVVRLGPNTLSFSDPAAIKTIYGLNKGFVKVSMTDK